MNGNLKTVILLVAMFVSGPALAQVSAYGAAARVNSVEIRNATLEKNFEEYQRENNVNIAAIRYPDRVKEMKREVLEELIDHIRSRGNAWFATHQAVAEYVREQAEMTGP